MSDLHLVTQFPNFLGSRLVERILEEENTRALCLVEPNRLGEANQQLSRLASEQRDRVELLTGDEASMHLGLAAGEYLRLRREASVIHHLPRLEREADGPKGADNLLDLSREASKLQRYCLYSSVRVAGRRGGRADEDELAPGAWSRRDEARIRIEKKVRNALRDLPATIFRPSQVIGDSRTGEIPRDGLPLEAALRLALPPFRLPLPPPGFGSAPFHAVPADWVANAAVRLSRTAGAVGRTFHLVDPDPMPLGWVWEQVASKMGWSSLGRIRALLGIPLLGRLFADGGPFERLVDYGYGNTQEFIDGIGNCPPLHSYLDRLLSWAEDQVRGRQPPQVEEDPFA